MILHSNLTQCTTGIMIYYALDFEGHTHFPKVPIASDVWLSWQIFMKENAMLCLCRFVY